MFKTVISLILCGATMIDPGKAAAQYASTASGTDPKVDAGREAESSARLAQIETEIAALDEHRWAGEYYQGDGLGYNLTLALSPKAGFVFVWRGCEGDYTRNYGDVIVTDSGHLRLRCAFKCEGLKCEPKEFLSIHWGRRHYLIPSDEILRFCDAINWQIEPRAGVHGAYYLRTGDHRERVVGLPELPSEFLPYLLEEPIRAQILVVENSRIDNSSDASFVRTTTVKLNAGRADHILPGMTLRICESIKWAATYNVIVKSVEERTSLAVISQPAFPRWRTPTPVIGWELSTGCLYPCKSGCR